MFGRSTQVEVALCAWVLAVPMLWWGRLPGHWRRAGALLMSAMGIVFLVAGMRSEGVREVGTDVAFLMGSTQVTERATASASLPYYVLTGVCLLLGTLGLAVGDEIAGLMRRHWLTAAVVLSLGVTILRFGLEKVAAPPLLAAVTGVVWLPPIAGAFFIQNLRSEGKGLRALVLTLLGYAILVRGSVAALILMASTLRLGSHYDVTPISRIEVPFSHTTVQFEPGSLWQMLELGVFPQLLFWTAFTLVTGLLGAAVFRLVGGLAGTEGAAPAAELAALAKDR